jgi:hypothetical protein
LPTNTGKQDGPGHFLADHPSNDSFPVEILNLTILSLDSLGHGVIIKADKSRPSRMRSENTDEC